MLDSGVSLTTVLCEYGERPHTLNTNRHVNYALVRSRSMVWNKESLMNIGISRLPEGWRYVATVDADIRFRRADWAAETVHAHQHYDVLQPWSDCYDLGPTEEHLQSHKSFCSLYVRRKPIAQMANGVPGYEFGHPGYAWSWTREALEWTGGLIDTAALGAGDHHMALALLGRASDSIPVDLGAGYRAPILRWQDRATRHICGRIGCVPGTIEHMWHGAKAGRAYVDRWSILIRHAFDPATDLMRNTHGVVELAGNKPELARDIVAYFQQRNEDATTMP
jgi:hypothetical protein